MGTASVETRDRRHRPTGGEDTASRWLEKSSRREEASVLVAQRHCGFGREVSKRQ